MIENSRLQIRGTGLGLIEPLNSVAYFSPRRCPAVNNYLNRRSCLSASLTCTTLDNTAFRVWSHVLVRMESVGGRLP